MVTNLWVRTNAYFDLNRFWKFLKATLSEHSILTICFGNSILYQFVQTYFFTEQIIVHIKKE